MKKYFTILLAVYFAMLLISCGNLSDKQQRPVSTDSTHTTSNADTMQVEDLTHFKYNKLIGNIPIPFDILRFHEDVPLSYNQVAVNPPTNVVYYISNTSKALNLGIYGADLAYCITYKRLDVTISYLKCAKRLADDLGIPMAFDMKTLKKCEAYSTNKDTLEKIVFDAYAEVDKSLKSNERIGLASLVITGGWLEGLYATLTTLNNSPENKKSANLYNKILEQKNYLAMIINMLDQFKDNPAYANIINDLKDIDSVYEPLSNVSYLNNATMSVLTQKVGVVRSKIIAH